MSKDLLTQNQINSWQKELDSLMQNPQDKTPRDFAESGKKIASLQAKLDLANRYTKTKRQLEEAQNMISDATDSDLKSMAEEEVATQSVVLEELEIEIQKVLVPGDPDDEKDIILEVRAGIGGDEAGLFAGELYKVYLKYAESLGFDAQQISITHNDQGGIKEVIAKITAGHSPGAYPYETFKYEKGTHRVQRVPVTEASGRIHTSAVTVAVLPMVEDVDIEIKEADLKIETMRSSGPGGQSVNKTDSAVRITHIPTGVIVTSQDSKSQLQNKKTALSILKSRIYESQREEREAKEAKDRKVQVGTGDRSGKIRTYNFPQDRVTDHRIKKSWKNLPKIMHGEIGDIIQELQEVDLQAKIKNATSEEP